MIVAKSLMILGGRMFASTQQRLMVVVRRNEAGFTLTEAMVVVVILSLLAALSTPLLSRDNTARKGRGWANIVAQGLQKARFQALGDRANIHVQLYRDRFETYRAEPDGSLTLLSTIVGPEPNGDKTIAIWDARTDGAVPTTQNSGPLLGDITFLPLGSTFNNANWRVYIRNEMLASNHPDASFVINIRGLTGFVSSNDKVVLP
jgi:prepilin-type N-terminal cleavage/methylation domain-containing protein